LIKYLVWEVKMFDSIIKEVGSISRFSDLFCLLIVGIAVYTFIIFHIDTSKLYKNIKLLTNSIKGKNKMDINKILNFKKDKLISSQKLLSELWDKYC
jgi:flagellar motor component MotA